MKKMKALFCFNGIKNLYFHCHNFQRLPLLSLYSTSSSISSTKEGNSNPSSSSFSSISNYLVNSLGFSIPEALSFSSELTKKRGFERSKKVTDIDLVENAVAVVHFFKQHGFQDSDIRKLIICEPLLLVARVDKTLKPKIKILLDLGFPLSDLIFTVTRRPIILNGRLGLAVDALRTVLGSDDDVIKILKRSSGIVLSHTANYLIPNVELLENCYAIPRGKINGHILRQLRPFVTRTDLLRDKLIMVEEKLGIPRDSSMFLYALHMVCCLSEESFEGKCRIFKSFGWTQSDVTTLIRRNPWCMKYAEVRIKENLDFLMNQLGYEPGFLASKPSLLTFSVKKRLLPRHKVLEVLKEKGLLRMHYSLASAHSITEPCFLKKFVLPFEEVHKVYAQLKGSTSGSLTLPAGRHSSQEG